MDTRKITIQDFMSPAPQTVGRDTPLSQARELMGELEIRHLPVVEGGKIIGIISDRDIRVVEALDGIPLEKILVDDLMSRDPYTVTPETPLEEVAKIMTERKIGSAIVLNKNKPVGIFTSIDALRALVRMLHREGA